MTTAAGSIGEALVAQLVPRSLGLAEFAEAHPAQHLVALRELDLVVLNDLYAIAPRVAKVESAARQHRHPRLPERAPHGLAIVHDKPEVPLVVRALPAPLGERDELVPEI